MRKIILILLILLFFVLLSAEKPGPLPGLMKPDSITVDGGEFFYVAKFYRKGGTYAW